MNEPSNENERASLGLFLDLEGECVSADSGNGLPREPTALPVDNGQVVRVRRPFKDVLFCLELLQLHRQPPLVNLSFGKDAEMARQSKFVADCDKPFGRVPLVPFHGVPIVHRELMVEVMVTLSERHKRCDKVVSWRVLVIECAFT